MTPRSTAGAKARQVATRSAADPARVAVPLVLALVVIANVSELTGLNNFACLGVLGFLLACTVWLRSWLVLPAVLMYFLFYSYWAVLPQSLSAVPAVPFLLPFGLTYFVLRKLLPAENTLSWLRRGQIDKATVFWIFATSIGSTVALLTWAFWSDNLGIGLKLMNDLGSLPTWLLILGVPVFALINAVGEELFFRGFLQESLQRSQIKPLLAITFQATAFAAIHAAAGFPNGAVGYAMTFTYACMLGYLRRRTGGMLAPYIAHVVADLCIGYFLVFKTIP